MKINYRFTDTGHWLARCDHSKDVIELNSVEFGKLSPLYQDYVWVHECIHLLRDIYDESECNRITDEVFLRRATSEDRNARVEFVKVSNSNSLQDQVSVVPDANKRTSDSRKLLLLALTFSVLIIVYLSR